MKYEKIHCRTKENVQQCDEYVEFIEKFSKWSKMMVDNEFFTEETVQNLYKLFEMEVAVGNFSCLEYLRSECTYWEI